MTAAAERRYERGVQRAFRRSLGRRQVTVGLVVVVLGGVILAFTASAGSVVLVPTGMLFGGLYELARREQSELGDEQNGEIDGDRTAHRAI